MNPELNDMFDPNGNFKGERFNPFYDRTDPRYGRFFDEQGFYHSDIVNWLIPFVEFNAYTFTTTSDAVKMYWAYHMFCSTGFAPVHLWR